MICFENNREYVLRPADFGLYEDSVSPVLEEEETVLATCQTLRNGMIFTNRRIIAVDIQGMLGTQIDVCSLYYRSVRSFATDRNESFCSLELFLAGQKMVRFLFDYPDADISAIATAVSRFTI